MLFSLGWISCIHVTYAIALLPFSPFVTSGIPHIVLRNIMVLDISCIRISLVQPEAPQKGSLFQIGNCFFWMSLIKYYCLRTLLMDSQMLYTWLSSMNVKLKYSPTAFRSSEQIMNSHIYEFHNIGVCSSEPVS